MLRSIEIFKKIVRSVKIKRYSVLVNSLRNLAEKVNIALNHSDVFSLITQIAGAMLAFINKIITNE